MIFRIRNFYNRFWDYVFSGMRLRAIFFLAFSILILESSPGIAGVTVLANYTSTPVKFSLIGPDGKQNKYTLDRIDIMPVPVVEPVGISFQSDGETKSYQLQANCVEYFIVDGQKLDLRALDLPVLPDEDPKLPPPKPRNVDHKTYTFTVKILADDDHPAVQRVWEKELRDRMAQASDIFERHCGVRFEVKAVDTWVSDNEIRDFERSLREFETKVDPAPAQVAIGFTSQYEIPSGVTHLGGTRGPLHPYVLIREWSQHVTRSERLEILVHELGHFLGASHSADPFSVMRPQLGDRRSNASSFRIGFDPLNTLAMNIVADELRSPAYHGFWSMPLDTKRQLGRIYSALGKGLPRDPAAQQYLGMLNMPVFVAKKEPPKPPELGTVTKAVVEAVSNAARINQKSFAALKGDSMTEYLIGQAAAEAANHPPSVASKAFLLGIGIALDDSNVLRDLPGMGDFVEKVESTQDRQVRLTYMGKITMRGRHDSMQHFVVSSALAATLGPVAAEQSGIAKEIADANGQSGFSFIDIMADLAGITFAAKISDRSVPLDKLAKSFKINDFLPESDELKEGLSWQQFANDYGSISDKRYQQVKAEIQQRIRLLPGYK